MKRSIIGMMTFAVLFACILSCNEQDDALETQDIKRSVSARATGASNGERVDGSSYTSAVGDPISLATAQKWAAHYRGGLENPDERLAHFFGFEIINQILNQSDCIGIRIYYGIDDDGKKQLMLVGVDSSGENMLPMAGGKTSGDGNIIADASFPCPDVCPEIGL